MMSIAGAALNIWVLTAEGLDLDRDWRHTYSILHKLCIYE